MNHHRTNFKSNEEIPDQPVVEASSSSNGSGGGEKKHPHHHQAFSSKLILSSQPSSSSPLSSGKSNTNSISTMKSNHRHYDIENNAPSRDIGNKPPPKLPPPSTKYLKKKDNESLVEEMTPLYPINNRPVKQQQQKQQQQQQSNLSSSSDGRKISPAASDVSTSTLLKEDDEAKSKLKGKSYGHMNHNDDDNKKNQPPSQPKRRNSNTGGEQEDDEDVSNSNKNTNMVITDQLYGQPSQRSLLSTGNNEDLMVGEGDLSGSCLSYAHHEYDDDYTETSSIAGSSIADLSRASTIKSGVIAIGVVMADNGGSVGSSSVASRSMIADATFNNHDDDAIHQQRNNKVSLLQHCPPPPSKEEEVGEKKKTKNDQGDDILSAAVAKDLAQREHDLKMKLSGKNTTSHGEKQVVVPRSLCLPRGGRERLLGRSTSRTNVNIQSEGRPSFLLESLKREASTRILEEPEEYIVGGSGGGGGAAGTTTSAAAAIPPPPPARLMQRGLSSSSFASSVASSDAESSTGGGGTPRLRRGNRKRCDSASSGSSGGGLSSSDRQEKVRAAMGAMVPSTRRLSRSTSYRLGAGHRSSPSPSPTLASTTRKQPPPADDDLAVGGDIEEEEECPSLSFRTPSLRSTSSGLTLDENTRNEIINASSSHHQRMRTSSSGSGTRDDDIEAKIRASSSMSSQNSTARRRQSSLASIEGRAAATARLARRTTSSSSSRPSDDKQSLRITPPAAVAAAARRSSSFEAATSSGTASVASSSTAAATSRPSDEKASYRRGATGGIASSSSWQQEQQRPGAHAISNQNVPRNSKTEGDGSGRGGGLSLASGDSRQPLESENPQPFEPVTSSDISSPMNDNINSNGEDADIEAQAGVPVLLPGAFAVTSMDQEDDGGYDSGFEDGSTAANEGVQVSGSAAAATSSGGGEEGDDNSPPMLRPDVPDAPLQAELYEQHVVDGLVLAVDEDEENGKRSQRIPTCFKSFLVMVLAIIGITIFLVVSKTGSDGEGEEIVGQDDLPPELEGWSQLGEVLMGPTSTDNAKFGYSVSMSGDGNRLAIGLPGANGGDGSSTGELSSSGSVHIYDLNGTDWIKVHEISGPGNLAEAGKAVALSYDGKRVAFSAPKWEEVGFIAVYEEEFLGNWSVVGEVPLGNPEIHDRWSLDLSNNGTILAVGNGDATSDDGNERAGKVRVFHESNKTWALLGEEIDGDKEGILLGWSLSLSGNGDRLALAAIGSNEYAGDVRVFGFDGVTSWVRLGSILQGDESSREHFGSAVALSNDGMTVAVGSPNYAPDDGEKIGAGRVRIFRLDDDHEEAEEESSSRNWIDLGDPLDGTVMFDAFGTSLALSADGRIVAVGVPESDTFGEDSGTIQLFEYDVGGSNKWIQLGSDIGSPTTERGKFGFSVEISADGSRFAGAAPETVFDGHVNDVGEVWVFNRTTAAGEEDNHPMGGDE